MPCLHDTLVRYSLLEEAAQLVSRPWSAGSLSPGWSWSALDVLAPRGWLKWVDPVVEHGAVFGRIDQSLGFVNGLVAPLDSTQCVCLMWSQDDDNVSRCVCVDII